MEEFDDVSEECIDLIKRLITSKDKRLTIDEIIKHPWFVDNSQ